MHFSSRAKPRNHRRPSRPLTDHNVPPTDELQPWLEDQDVDDVDEVAGVVGQQPQVDVFGRLVGKRPAHGDQPHVPVPRCHHQEEPQDVDEICRDGKVLVASVATLTKQTTNAGNTNKAVCLKYLLNRL